MADLITRQAAIDVLDRNHILGQGLLNDTLDHIADAIMALPSAQPETHEEHTETHACDCISRQAAIEWLKNEWNGMVTSLFDGIKALPSAQAEIVRCKDCRYMTEHYDTDGNVPYWTCSEWDSGTDYDGFCHYAERRTDEQDSE